MSAPRTRSLLLVACAVSAAGCARGPREDVALTWSTQLPAGAVVHLLDGSGNITVRRASGDQAVVSGIRRWRRGRSTDLKFVVQQQGNDYYLCAMWRGSGKCGAKGYRGRRTGSFLEIFSLFHRSSDATAEFAAELPASVTVDARTTNGSVQIEGIAAGVTAHTTNGTIQAWNVAGPLSLSAINGNVRVTADSLAPSDPVTLTTTNGTVRAELPAGLQGTFDLSTVNGSVSSDFPIAAATGGRFGRHLQGQIGQSNRPVKLHAVNGTVTLTSRGTPAAQ